MEYDAYLKHKDDEPPEEIKRYSKKKTRKWCKGKKGVEHKPRWIPEPKHKGLYSLYECETCNKILDYCFMWGWRPDKCKCGLHKEESK